MKNLLLLVLFIMSLPLASAGPCDKDEIFNLMVETGYIDVNDPSFCVEMENFPKIQIKMDESNYGVNSTRDQDPNAQRSKQDEALKNIVIMLNNSQGEGQKFNIKTKGIADGIRNNDSSYDQKILETLAVNGKVSLKKINEVIRPNDPKAAEAIELEMKRLNQSFKPTAADDADVPFNKIEDKTRLKSLLRNFILAKKRGDGYCSDIFKSSVNCESTGMISPDLDSGEGNYKGCCNDRRGAIVDLFVPDIQTMSKAGNGTYKPPFTTPDPEMKGKLQMAASMAVFDLKIAADSELENEVMTKDFEDDYSDEEREALIERDRARFRAAMKDTGCADNKYAVDNARKIFWAVKSQKDKLPKDFYDAVMANDFKKVYQFYKDAQKKKVLNSPENKNAGSIISMLFSAGTQDSLKNPIGCPKMGVLYRPDRGDKSDFQKCALTNFDPEVKNYLKNESTEPNLWNLLNSKKIKNSEDVFVLSDLKNQGNFYIFDRRTNKRIFFSFDSTDKDAKQNCVFTMGMNLKKKGKEIWSTKQSSEEIPVSCMQSRIGRPFKLNMGFFPQSSKVREGVVPTDPLNCLDVSKALDHDLEKNKGMEKPFCLVQSNQNLNLVLNPKELAHVGGAANGKQGFMCTGCASGMRYVNKNLDYSPREDKFRGKSESTVNAKATYFDAIKNRSQNPLSLAALKSMQSYVIPNCGETCEDACACLRDGDIKKRISDPSTIRIDFTQVEDGVTSKKVPYTGDKPKSFACVFTPPVPQTCSHNPVGDSPSGEDHNHSETATCPVSDALKKLPKTVTINPKKLEEYQALCQSKEFPMSEKVCKEKENSMCVSEKIKAGLIEAGGKKTDGTKTRKE